MKKALIAVVLILLLVLFLSTCQGNEQTPENTEPPETTIPVESRLPAETAAPVQSPEPETEIEVTLTDADETGLDLPEEKICVVDEEGMQISITLGGNAENVRICAADYDEDFNFRGAGDVLWEGGDMPAGSRIGLRIFIPDTAPNTVLCYTDAAGSHIYGISQSGKDGSLLLLDMLRPFGIM